jgi:ATP-dependent RNA helicase DDX56/DBP9
MSGPSILDTSLTFPQFCEDAGIDRRLSYSLAKMGFAHPTLIQRDGIPGCLEGRDVLMNSRTGSGKTLAYVVPLVQRLLAMSECSTLSPLSGIILVPTAELCSQVLGVVRRVLGEEGGFKPLTVDAYHNNKAPFVNRVLPQVLVSTPDALVRLLKDKGLKGGLSDEAIKLRCLVVDEADSILNSDPSDAMMTLSASLPPSDCQSILVSATLSDAVTKLQGLLLHKPKVISVNEEANL